MPGCRSMIGIGWQNKEIVLHMETRFLWLFVQRSTPRGRELSDSFPIITSEAYAEDAIRFHLIGNRHWLLILFLFHKFVVLRVWCKGGENAAFAAILASLLIALKFLSLYVILLAITDDDQLSVLDDLNHFAFWSNNILKSTLCVLARCA